MGDIWNIKGTLKNKMANERGQRAFSMGGITPSITTTTDFISINTKGNAVDFGDLITATQVLGGCANSIRAFYGGG